MLSLPKYANIPSIQCAREKHIYLSNLISYLKNNENELFCII